MPGLLGGLISDFYTFIFAFLYIQGTLSTIFLALAGAALLSSFSVTVIAAQEAIPDNKALAAGLAMGLAGGIGGLAVIGIGQIGDIWGLSAAVSVIFILPILAGIIGLAMKSRPAACIERKVE